MAVAKYGEKFDYLIEHLPINADLAAYKTRGWVLIHTVKREDGTADFCFRREREVQQ